MKNFYLENNVEEKKIEKINSFKELFLEYNKTTNLSSIRDSKEFNIKNILDSLGIIEFSSFENKNILDIGTGGGFPGFLLAILFPSSTFYLNDSNNKKIKWIEFAKKELNVNNIVTLNNRVEELDKYNNFFDLIVTRAVAKIPIVLEISSYLCKIGGEIIFYKGINYKDELCNDNLIKTELGVEFNKIKEWDLNKEYKRYFIFYKKIGETKKEYPREFSKIKKSEKFFKRR